MDEGLVHPCLELGDEHHRVLTWAGRNARKKDSVILMDPKTCLWAAKAEEDTFSYLEDTDWIERMPIPESFRWKVLRPCTCGGEIRLSSGEARASVATVPPHRSGASHRTYDLDASAGLGVKSETVRKPVNQLAWDFPQLVRDAGIQMTPLQTNYPALANNLRRWHYDQGISINTIRLMMQEFIRHPEWCQRSRGAPWAVFLGRREQLANLLAYNKREHPGNRQYITDDEHWVYHPPRRTPAVNYAT